MLIKCPECGEQISDQAEACPHCGAPTTNNARPRPEAVQTSSRDEGVKVKQKSVRTRIVVVVYLVAVVGACLYVPSYKAFGGVERASFAYRWLWDMSSPPAGSIGFSIDYGRVALEAVGLTAIVGILMAMVSLLEDRKQRSQHTR